jgi:hypothetical protein
MHDMTLVQLSGTKGGNFLKEKIKNSLKQTVRTKISETYVDS